MTNQETEMENVPQLFRKDGFLCAPNGEYLMRRYPEGDFDFIRNANGKQNQENLRAALFDAREVGDLPADCQAVMLPSGKVFSIDGA